MLRKLIVAIGCLLPVVVHAAAGDDMRRYADEARSTSTELLKNIRTELVREFDRSGPLRAIIVCKYTAPEITAAISRKTGWRVSRVSLRARNPALGYPDSWEQRVLLDFDNRVSLGEKADTLEHAEIVQEPMGRFFRYMRAIPAAAPCTSCHGPNTSEAVREQLQAEYPHDAAVGYLPGQVRGAVTIKRPL